MKYTALILFIGLAVGVILGAFGWSVLTLSLPPAVSDQDLTGWTPGSEQPPSYMTGKPLCFLTYRYGPARNDFQTGYYLIRYGIGGWYLALGNEVMLIGPPDYWKGLPR